MDVLHQAHHCDECRHWSRTYGRPRSSEAETRATAVRLDSDVWYAFRAWAFYHELTAQKALERLLTEFLAEQHPRWAATPITPRAVSYQACICHHAADVECPCRCHVAPVVEAKAK